LEKRNFYDDGLTLVEVLLVLVIITIIISIAVPIYMGTMQKIKEEVCKESRLRVERMYELHLFYKIMRRISAP
jgi:prepilin-type N-terminal cleavage/methylation domain-containing protein